MAFENRQTRAARDLPLVAHVVEAPATVDCDSRVVRGGRSSTRSRGGRGFRSRVQCQIYNQLGHVAQQCYYRFDRDYGGPDADALADGGAARARGYSPMDRVVGGQWVC